MRAYLLIAPWWVLSLFYGTIFGPATAVFIKVRESSSWTTALAAGALSGIMFGAIMGPTMAQQNRRHRQAAGDLSPQDFFVVQRAARRGPIPTDPRLRAAAARAATFQLDNVRRHRRSGILIFGLGLVLSVAFVFQSRWWLLAMPAYAYLLITQWELPKRLERRRKLLSDDVDTAA